MSRLTVARARVGVRGLLAVFWLLVVSAGALNPGYSHLTDHVSDLASFGARAPWVGILAIAAFGLADLIGARVLAPATRRGAVSLAAAGAAGVAIAVSRIHCSEGAAGCATATVDDNTWTDSVHSGAVIINALAFCVALLACALGPYGSGRRRGWRALVVVLALLSLFLLSRSVGTDHAGAWQRGWLLTNTGALLLVTLPRPGDPS